MIPNIDQNLTTSILNYALIEQLYKGNRTAVYRAVEAGQSIALLLPK